MTWGYLSHYLRFSSFVSLFQVVPLSYVHAMDHKQLLLERIFKYSIASARTHIFSLSFQPAFFDPQLIQTDCPRLI